MEQRPIYEIRAPLDERELEALFVTAWGASKPEYCRVLARSFSWVTAKVDGNLIGFVNVAWDGGVHFFLLDTTVHPEWRGGGIGRGLVEAAIRCCRGKGEWLHVDAPIGLMQRLYAPCGFGRTEAGLIHVADTSGSGTRSGARRP